MNEPARRFRSPAPLGLALGLITLTLYLPALRHEFLVYDDQQYVTENTHVRVGLGVTGLGWAFGFHAGNWHPLTWLSHMLDCQLYGLNPAGHHFTNVLLHALSTALLFLVLHRLTGAVWRSAAVAALFGWHPLHVESVAWVAERKDVLCAFFGLLALWAYARYVEEAKVQSPKSKVSYGLALLFFALGLMSKPMLVTWPLVMLLLDVWPMKRFTIHNSRFTMGRLLLEKTPFFALSAAVCVLTVRAQQLAIVPTAGLPVSQRLVHAVVSYAHYLGAMIVPRGLAVYYPYEVAVPVGRTVFACLLLVAVSAFAIWLRARRPWLLFGWLWFLGTLVPVIGLVQVGDQAWADRYTYLPLVGLFVGGVWSTAEVVNNRKVLGGLSVVLAVALLVGTTLQLRHWRNTRTLFEHAARVTPGNYMAITMLGSLLAKDGKLDEAIEHYHTALRLKPGFPEAHFFLGNALELQGRLDEAIAEYRRALWFKPIMETTHILLGAALAKKRNYDEAVSHYLAALKVNPESAVAHNNLARVLLTQGRVEEALAHCAAALELDPNLAAAHNNLGVLLLQQGRVAEGAAQLREALRLEPDNAETQFNLALALNQQRQWAEAAALFAKTVGTTSADPNAHYQFALALAHTRRTREAMARFASALLLQPDFPDALDGLAWILATDSNPEFRNGAEAVRMAERACELTGRKDAVKLRTLATAYAEVARFPEATATAQSALNLAADRKELAAELERMLGSFKLTKPWRQ